MNNDDNIFCTQNGKIIDLNNGTIKESCRDDLVLNISKFNLVDREQSDSFMNREMEMYIKLHGADRINFMLDFIAYKMLGKNIQSALFMIGTGATGKTTFSQIMNMLFDDKSIKVPYEYFTNEHRGNDDKFVYEKWMDEILEEEVIDNYFDFSRALKLIQMEIILKFIMKIKV